jgi:hypothetical protein
MSNYLKKDTMKRTYEDLDQELLDITRDLMTSMGINPLTDDLIKVQNNLFKFIWMYEKIKDHTISKVSKDLRKSLTPEMKTKLKELMKEKKWKKK